MSRFEPVEIEIIEIQIKDEGNNEETAIITLLDVSSVPPFEDRCKVMFKSGSYCGEASGFCYFGAFQKIRTELDELGIIPLVNAAIENCYPSNMASDMGAGLKVYKLEKGINAEMSDLVSTFEKPGTSNFALVTEQKRFYADWVQSLVNAT